MKYLTGHPFCLTPLLWLGATLSAHAVLSMPDALNRNWGQDATVATPAQVLAEAGAAVDNTYSASLTFTVTMEYHTLNNGTGSDAFAAFHLWNGATEKVGIGDSWNATNWGGFNFNGPDDFSAGGGPFPLTINTPEAITIRIDYVAGGDDTMTVTFRGADNVRTGDFSFDRIIARSGNNTTSFTGMTLSLGSGDADGDGMTDGWETVYGLDPNDPSDASEDILDNDGLTNLQEFQNNAFPNNPDTDGDGLLDGPEVEVHGTLANNTDSDGDQLLDGAEVAGTTLANNADTDGDGYSDSQELAAGTNPNLITSVPTRYIQKFNGFGNGDTIFVDGSRLQNNNGIASVQNGALRLTQAGNNGAASVLRVPPLSGSSLGWVASFDVRIRNNRGTGEPADGLSFSYGALPATGLAPVSEEGWTGTDNHISYEIDTYDDLGVERGVNLAEQAEGNPQADLVGGFTNGRILNPGTEVAGTVICTFRPDPVNIGQSLASFTTTGLVTNAAFNELAALLDGMDAYTFALAARTGGLNESVLIDNLAVVAGANSDTDGDTLPDAWEYGQIGSLSQTAISNTDGDAFNNAAELANGTSPVASDSDGDGLSDSNEVTVHLTNPNVADPDLDTISDSEEIILGADGFVTNPNLADTDGDTFSDEEEIADGADPTNAASFPGPTLVLYYPFDVQNGTTVANGAGGIAGSIVGGGSYTAGQSAAFGTAFLANRTGANDARVETGLSATQLGLLSKYTVMAWVRWDGTSGADDQMIFGQVGGTPQLHHGLRLNGGGTNDVHFGHWGNDVGDSGSVTQGVWVHLAWSWNGLQGKTFVNGVEAANTDGDQEGPLESSAVNRIVAVAFSDLGGSFNGAVDEAKVFDLDMTAAQILAASAGPASSSMRVSNVTYDAITSRLLLTVQGIPAGPTFHLRSSTTLQGWIPLTPAINFNSATPQPLSVPVTPGSIPKQFFRVQDGVSP